MITSTDMIEDFKDSPDCRKNWQPTEQDIADYRKTAKEVNEHVWQCTVDTLATILGNTDGAVAKTQIMGIITRVIQHIDSDGKPSYIIPEPGGPIHIQFDLKDVENADEPIWIAA